MPERMPATGTASGILWMPLGTTYDKSCGSGSFGSRRERPVTIPMGLRSTCSSSKAYYSLSTSQPYKKGRYFLNPGTYRDGDYSPIYYPYSAILYANKLFGYTIRLSSDIGLSHIESLCDMLLARPNSRLRQFLNLNLILGALRMLHSKHYRWKSMHSKVIKAGQAQQTRKVWDALSHAILGRLQRFWAHTKATDLYFHNTCRK